MNPEPDRLLDLLGSELNRRILAQTSGEPLSAEAITERADSSLPTVYRHIDDLMDADLLEEAARYDTEGNHYKVYHAGIEAATVHVDDGRLSVSIDHTDAKESAAADDGAPRRPES